MTDMPFAEAIAEVAIELPDHRRLTVRGVRPSDDTALCELYEALDDDDHRRRFFCAYHPQPEFFQRLANPPAGAARIVAELSGAAHAPIVGEAGYLPLPNGNGELEMVVARPWRGWLGPYLLDVLVEIAADRHVPNLEADVLTDNRPMQALLRARGAVVLSHDGWSDLRLMIGTVDRTPTWPAGGAAPRLLVETPSDRWALEDQALAAGMRTIICPGPSRNGVCPALHGRPCRLVADADLVVVRPPADDDEWNDLLDAHRTVHPDVPIVRQQLGGGARGADTLDQLAARASGRALARTARSGDQNRSTADTTTPAT